VHRENASSMDTAGATANTTEGNSRASRESGLLFSHIHTGNNREDASYMVTAGATANTTEGNSRASRESGLVCSHSHGESIDVYTGSASNHRIRMRTTQPRYRNCRTLWRTSVYVQALVSL